MVNRDENSKHQAPDFVLDITAEVCPLTFVRTKLLIEGMAAGQVADILLCGREPLENVPRAVVAQGHAVLEFAPAADAGAPAGAYRLRVQKVPAGASARITLGRA